MAYFKAVLIEDNESVLDTLNTALKHSYEILLAKNGKDGLELIKKERPDLIILDLNLPDIPGLIVCRQTRKIGVKAPILILSGDGSLSTKLELFSCGADDYLVKPFSLGELEARLNAISRRLKIYREMMTSPRSTSLILDRDTESVTREGSRPIYLRHKEYAILDVLVKHANQTLSRDHLRSLAWRNNKPWSNSIDVHIKTLRDKIDRPFKHQLIKTIHGVGYRLEDQ
jgi:DNA-binding response OmpR family regulator